MQIQGFILIVLTVWLVALSAVALWFYIFLGRLTKDVKNADLIKILDKVLATGKDNTKEILDLAREIRRVDEQGKIHFQKVGTVKFNPFEEFGGDHSFTLCLLDAKHNGFIITGLHARDRTRMYFKEVSNGKPKLDLSKEEEKALEKAKNSK